MSPPRRDDKGRFTKADPTDFSMADLVAEDGSTGLVFTNAGYVDEEFLPNLIGRNAIKVYKEMRDNDSVTGAVLFCIDMLLRSVEWKAEENPGADDPEGDAQFLQECMEDMSHTWPDFISEVMSMLPFGWSWFETVYKLRNGPQNEDDPEAPASSKFTDGKVGWRKFAIRAQESWDHWQFDDGGSVQAMVQRAAPDYNISIIPIAKSLLFRTKVHKNNPEGRSIFRNAYRSWFFKQRIEIVEGVGIERDLAGLPVADVDPSILMPNADAESVAIRSVITRIVQGIKRDKNEGVLWPLKYDSNGNKMYDLRLLNSGGSRQFDTNAIITRYSQAIAMTVLADFILLGHENVGSFALSSDKTDLFAVAMGTFLDSIAEVLNRFGVPRLWKLNGWDASHCPTIVHGDLDEPDLAEMGAYILALVQAGMPLFPDSQLENHLRQIAHLPEVSEEDQVDDVSILPEDLDVPINPLDLAKPQAMAPPAPGGPGGPSGSNGQTPSTRGGSNGAVQGPQSAPKGGTPAKAVAGTQNVPGGA